MEITSFFNYTIEEISIENSSICNAECPQCTRQALGNDHSWFSQDYLRIEILEKIPDNIWKNIKRISLCGVMGDPCAAPNLIQLVEWIRYKSPSAFISIETNGGLKSIQFWKKLASILGDNGSVQFAIDGLEDTNHIYRVKVEWKKLMENVNAFISVGGTAVWQFIVFRHNEHQVDQAERLAKDLGFKQFNIKTSTAFVFDEIFNFKKLGSAGIPIKPPLNSKYIHPVLLNQTKTPTIDGIMDETVGKNVACYSKKEKSVYIDYTGRVYPCCFIGGSIYMYDNFQINDVWNKLWDEFGKNKLSLVHHEFNDILESEFFYKLEKSWKATSKENSCFVCTSTCTLSPNKTNDPYEFDKQIIKRL
jgi:MoaA/NifB/PqqE/SkfB family radical SAM enzyme